MNETITLEQATTVDRAALKSELEATQQKFHALLDSLSDADWKAKSGNRAWTVGQLMNHVAWGTGFTLRGAEGAKNGKGVNPPQFILNPLNVLLTRLGSRGATRDKVRAKFGDSMTKVIASVDDVRDEDWAKSSRAFNETRTVEQHYRSSIVHFEEHEADVKRGLGRT